MTTSTPWNLVCRAYYTDDKRSTIRFYRPSIPPIIWLLWSQALRPGRVAQSVGHLTRKSGSWVRYPVWQHTFVSPSAFSRRAIVSYWRKYVHEVLVNRLGGLSLPRKSVVRLTDRPDMTLDVYRASAQENMKVLPDDDGRSPHVP